MELWKFVHQLNNCELFMLSGVELSKLKLRTAVSLYVKHKVCRIWGSHSGGYEEFCLLGHNNV
jgi:hypothetical protein